MKNKKILLAIVLIALIAILVIIFITISSGDKKVKDLNEVKKNTTVTQLEDNLTEVDLPEATNSDNALPPTADNLKVIKAAEIPAEILEISQEELRVIDLNVSEEGFSPSEFRVKVGQVVTINLRAVSEKNHSFFFVEKGMLSSPIVVTSGYSLGFSFVAPREAGVINFFDGNFPENKGKMIVE